MVMWRTMWILGVSALILTGTVNQGRAGVLNSYNGASGGGLASVLVINSNNPNNDNTTTQSPNSVHIDKIFHQFAPIDLSFQVLNSGGTTEYFGYEIVSNASGVNWADYHIQLGFGTGNSFQISNSLDGLDFDTPNQDPTPTAPYFATLDHQSDSINWSNGIFPTNPGAGWNNQNFNYTMDLPDFDAANMPASAAILDAGYNIIGYNVTIRQYPTVPEPSSMILLGTGLAGLCSSGWRKWKKAKSASEVPAAEETPELVSAVS